MDEFTGDERRRYARVGAELAVRVKLREGRVDYPAVFTRDVSTGGLGLEINAKWPDSFEQLMSWSGPVEVALDLSPEHTTHVKAVVVWGHVQDTKAGERRFRAGLRFVEVGEEDRALLVEFVQSKMVESMLERGEEPLDGPGAEDLLP